MGVNKQNYIAIGKGAGKGVVPVRESQKLKVKSQKAYALSFSLIENGSFISAAL